MSDINDLTDEQLDAAFNDAAAEADSELSLSNFSCIRADAARKNRLGPFGAA